MRRTSLVDGDGFGEFRNIHASIGWTPQIVTFIFHAMKTIRTNQLSFEKSPYLLQHKDNPIAWMPWGEAAFRLAREEKKPIFLSIGYSTCHWCHVMAHESFEKDDVAKILNENFISIKVDREEHPDVDQVYMTALQALSGGGGWPMSVWLTPEGKPFFAGTYFPRERFLNLLARILQIWSTEPDKLHADSEQLLATVKASEELEERTGSKAQYQEFLQAYVTHFHHHFDDVNGGFGGAPKFPQTMNLMVMMRQDLKSGLRQAEAIVNTTLVKMARGGIYDHLLGGFHRYSVDDKWLVPHFEKMLYDQAMITATLVEAHQLYNEPELKRAACETLDYVLREMTHPAGGFYSAQDADSLDPNSGHTEEGYFATFDYVELREFLTPEELSRLEETYGVTPAGNFEGRNILNLQDAFDGTVKEEPLLKSAFEKLRKLRASRPAPHLDDKVIVAWNGLMIASLVKAGLCFHKPAYIEAARKALSFVKNELWHESRLPRFWREGEARGFGAAEDYAAMIHACLELYQADFDPQWAAWALELQKVMDKQFWDISEGLYFANDGRETLLPLRPKDLHDGVTPCSNSMQAYNLARLHLLTGEAEFNTKFEKIVTALFGRMGRYPSSLSYMALALDFAVSNPKVAVLSGEKWVDEFASRERSRFHPHVVWARAGQAWEITRGKSGDAVYVCENGQCLQPAVREDEVKL